MTELSKVKIEANRRNSEKSTGPKNVTSTRYNALKHGLLSEGITELDDVQGYEGLCKKIEGELKPIGMVEMFLVLRIVLCMVRLRRACLLEAEYVTDDLNPPIIERTGGIRNLLSNEMDGKIEVIDPGLPARLSLSAIETLVDKLQRYETAIENKLYRALNQLERIQRMRQGEEIPPPAAVDLGVHSEKALASFGNSHQGGS